MKNSNLNQIQWFSLMEMHLNMSANCQQTPRKLLNLYRTEEGFWPDFADIKYDYTQYFYRSLNHLLSANVRGPVSFAVSGQPFCSGLNGWISLSIFSESEDGSQVLFDFLVHGELLRVPLETHMQEKGISVVSRNSYNSCIYLGTT